MHVFRTFVIGAALLAGGSLVTGHTSAAQTLVPRTTELPSFDCAKAKSASARLICADGDLARLDGQLSQAFRQRLDSLTGAVRNAFIEEQRSWINTRNNQCGLKGKDKEPVESLASAKSCMASAIRMRIGALSSPQQTARTPDARRELPPNLNRRTWNRVCGIVDQASQCDTFIDIQATNGTLGATVVLQERKGWAQKVLQIQVAKDQVSLQHGVRIILPSGNAIDLKLSNCRDNVCFAEYEYSAGDKLDMVALLKSRNTIRATAIDIFGQPVVFQIPPDRFGQVYDGISDEELARRQAAMSPFQKAIVRFEVQNCIVKPESPGAMSEVAVQVQYKQIFATDTSVVEFLNYIKSGVEKYCRDELQAGRLGGGQISSYYDIRIYVDGRRDDIGWIIAITPNDGRNWRITQNDVRAHLMQEQANIAAQQQANIERQRQVESKRTLQKNFMSQFNVQKWASEQELRANPFAFKNSIVGVRTNFTRMLSESEAIFFLQSAELLVTGVPATLFKGNEAVVLAVKMFGTRTVKTARGEATLPYGEYVGVYRCTESCTEFYD